MARIQLAADYYLHHFAEFLQVITQRYLPVLQQEHHDFMADYQQLSTDAQRLWLRMLNRKGAVFAHADLAYEEITNIEAVLAELCHHQFAAPLSTPADVASWFGRASKERLWRLVALQAEPCKKSASRAELQAFIQQRDLLCAETIYSLEPCVALRRIEPLQYLMFLFFGRFEQNLQAFTLRDLGVVRTGGLKTEFQARYQDAATAHSAFFFAKLRAHWRALAPKKSEAVSRELLSQWWQQVPSWPEALDEKTAEKREHLLYELGVAAQRADDPTLAIAFLSQSAGFAANERLLRLLQQTGQSEAMHQLLQQMTDDPSCDDELWFARDFSARLGKDRRVTDLTLFLQQAATLTLDELYLGQPERGAVQHFQQQGYLAWHVENELWLSLFGVLFWQELFISEHSAIFNEFERRPRDLTSPDFYRKQQDALEQKLAMLAASPQQTLLFILQNISRYYGTVNSIFRWHSALTDWFTPLLNKAPGHALASLLRKMAQDFRHHASGYPDLMLVRDDQLQFIELKAPGDSLRRHQMTRIRTMQALGFDVSVTKVQWWIDPARCYAVVDVETTGGTSEHERITEIAIVKVQHGEIISTYSRLVNPMRQIPAFITRLTGISQSMVSSAPIFAEIADEVAQQLDGCIFVAHNVKFDYGFVRAEMQRAGRSLQLPQLCTVVQSRRYFPGLKSYGLAALNAHFELGLTNHHRALADAQATAQLLIMINQQRMRESQQHVIGEVEGR